MSAWRQHRNPWAEKLSQVSLPDEGESWKGMEALLDREMRTGRRRQWRRWLLLILLLLLLIGVCHCPGRQFFLSGKSKGSFGQMPAGEKVRSGPSAPATQARNGTPVTAGQEGGRVVPESESKTEVPTPAQKGGDEHRGGDELTGGGQRRGGDQRTGGGQEEKVRATRPVRPTVKRRTKAAPTTTGNITPDAASDTTGITAANTTPMTPVGATANNAPKTAPKTAPKSAPKTALKTAPKTAAKKPLSPPEDSAKKEKQGGWMIGIGLNQFFTVGGQQASSWNSGGITGTLGDYIPVPMIRYYFNPKLYVQVEAQINTPQYIKKNVVAVSTPVDSIGTTTGGAVVTLQQTVAINKLFYFNVPLSVHYEVFDHLDLGAGLQYSRLTNGVGVFTSNYGQNGIDSSTSTETKSFRGDSVYSEIRTHEFRFLVDVNYNWKHFIGGVRYNQALSKFIHVEISPGQVTQARNSSLQLYLRYILWDGRRKKPLSTAK